MFKILPLWSCAGLAVLLAAGACNSGGGGGGGGSGGNGGSGGETTGDGGVSDGGANGSTSTDGPCLNLDDCNANGGTNGTAGGWNPGPGLEQCNSQGLAWIAVVNGGPGQCGESLVNWCCSEQEILRRFPAMAAQLETQFSTYKNGGLKLYNCSKSENRTTFHWTFYQSGIRYQNFSIEAAEADTSPSTPNCIDISSDDLGIPQGGGTGTDLNDGSGGNLPATIGEIADTSKAGMVAWLKLGSYESWTSRSTAMILNIGSNSPHSFGKHYFNSLAQSAMVTNGGASFAAGSIIVKERYTANDVNSLRGFDVMVKAYDALGANNWLFYEIFDSGGNFVSPATLIHGLGNASCTNCHNSTTSDDKGIVKSALPQ